MKIQLLDETPNWKLVNYISEYVEFETCIVYHHCSGDDFPSMEELVLKHTAYYHHVISMQIFRRDGDRKFHFQCRNTECDVKESLYSVNIPLLYFLENMTKTTFNLAYNQFNIRTVSL